MTRELEIGHLLFGNPHGEFIMPDYAIALLHYLLNEINRVCWNKNKIRWDWRENPKLEGITFNAYCWDYDDKEQQCAPNFKINDLEQEIRWYKHPGRGQTCSIEMTPDQWIKWFDYALIIINENDPANYAISIKD